jgi:membrane protease YdiL (CAAX protease family)
VEENPLQELIQTPAQALILVAVATIGGGLREEIQRAMGHSLQGWDAVLTTAMLGLFWGYVYIHRRSIVAPVVSHSGFNAAEIFVYLATRR